MSTPEDYMRRCLELAQKGYGFVNPNPMVGCVVVKNGKTIAEGFHKRFGDAHAEVNALRLAGAKAKGATLYVNLEPCVHFGKTPPCADAIIKARIRKVIAAAPDPNALMRGKGFEKLRRAGVSVRVGLLRREAKKLNEKFFTFMESGRPFVGLKVGQTLDGRIADYRGASKWITSATARREAHRIRAGYDAVLVGAGTVERDNPQLTVRLTRGNTPLRVVLDGKLNLRPNRRVFDARQVSTILFTSLRAFRKNGRTARRLESQSVRVIPLEGGTELDVRAVLRQLAVFGVSSVLVEGGSKTIAAFFNAGVMDKVHCFVAPKVLGGGTDAFSLQLPLGLKHSIGLGGTSVQNVGGDFLIEGYPQLT